MRVLMADPGGPPQAGALEVLAGALTELGATVTDVRVPAGQPASVFIRDVVLLPSPDHALVLRPHGHRGTTEPAAVADALRGLGLAVTTMPPGLRLDGGQCVATADGWLVGVPPWSSQRGERWVADRLAEHGQQATAVPLGMVDRHLDVAVADLGGRGWLRVPSMLSGDPTGWALWQGRPVLDLPPASVEALDANVLVVGETVVGDIDDPTRRAEVSSFLADLGLRWRQVDLATFRQRRGGVHCLTVEVRDPHDQPQRSRQGWTSGVPAA